ncbi:MAG: HAMP domain-containing histidine kinase [Solirubrobacteraceae bacterium]|nr:HAMP domain-containing histidine kinase [Solirubrobacteraceae bacterium]
MARLRSNPRRWLDRLPIRWRLAVVSAGLTGAILLMFAIAIGEFTGRRIRADFTTQTAARFDTLRERLNVGIAPVPRAPGRYRPVLRTSVRDLKGDANTVVRVFWHPSADQAILLDTTDPQVELGPPTRSDVRVGDYRVEVRTFDQTIVDDQGAEIYINGAQRTVRLTLQVGRSFGVIDQTTNRVRTALALGVLTGTLLALLAGLAVGQRAMRPVRRMTGTARHIARTRDLEAKMPEAAVNDEIAELSRTLQDMLDELAAAQATVDDTLQRQREFVADASHELRTPLTAVQANLELLALSVEGDDLAAVESALRSSRRMRRLVADLLLLARMDARRQTSRERVDLDRAILEAVDELEPQFGAHEVVLDIDPVTLLGVRDELVRMVANLLGNALRYTPDDTEVRIRLRADGQAGELVVEDDGPGVPEDLRDRIFERFVRHGGEGAGSTGIGLAIVQAAARRHGGDVRVEATHPDGAGARFVVTLRVEQRDGASDADPTAPPGDESGSIRTGGVEDARGLLTPSRRVARRVRRRLRSSRQPPPDVAERLGGAAPDAPPRSGGPPPPGPGA